MVTDPNAQPKSYRQYRYQAPPGATELLLVRHGESAPFVPGEPFDLVDGQGDPPLSPEGREQAERVAERLGHEHIDAIYVTTLRRTAETAAPLAQRLHLTPVVVPDLREVFLGEWEGGLFRQKVVDQDPVAQRVFIDQRWDAIPGAEPADAFRARVRRGVERLAADRPDQRIAVFSHGGTIGEILAIATGSQPFAFGGADNASISHLVVTDQRWLLRRFNDTAHLDAGMTVNPVPLT